MTKLSIRGKVLLSCVALTALVFALFVYTHYRNQDKFQHLLMQKSKNAVKTFAEDVNQLLFEQYQYTKAQGQNPLLHQSENWRHLQDKSPLVSYFNQTVETRPHIKLVLFVNVLGEVLAMNTVNNNGQKIPTKKIYNRNYKDESLFKKALNGQFTEGHDGLTGVAVGAPSFHEATKYMSRIPFYTIPFATRVTDNQGQVIGVLVHFIDMAHIDKLSDRLEDQLTNDGYKKAYFEILSSAGKLLYHSNHSAAFDDEDIKEILGRKDYIEEQKPSAIAAKNGMKGHVFEGIQAVFFEQEHDITSFKGLDWLYFLKLPQETVSRALLSTEEIFLLSLGALLFLLLCYYLYATIVQPVHHLKRTLTSFFSGDAETDIDTSGHDEFAEIRRLIAERQKSFIENMRIRASLDVVNTNVMIADENNVIVYMNKGVRDMLKNAEADIQQDLPNFSVDKIIGSSIDDYHKKPETQRHILAELKGHHHTKLRLGKRHFTLVAAPAIGVNGERLGSIVNWRDVTQELAVEDEINDIITNATKGNFDQRITADDKEGFMAKLSEGINNLLGIVEEVISEAATAFSALANGDVKHRIAKDFKGSLAKLKNDCNVTSEKLTEIVGEISLASDTIFSAATEVTNGSLDLSKRTEQQASNLEETAASMEELAATVKQNSQNAQQANELVADATNAAQKGSTVSKQAIDSITNIEQSSEKITSIISVIDEIAFQTNLLALNAAVEAARAGEAGRGFAVVADEVRNLAQRSAEASKEIKELIENSANLVKDGVSLVNEAGSSLTEITDTFQRVAELVSDIATASAEQASGVDEINQSITNMDEMTQQNAALVEESTAATQSLEEQVKHMNQLIAFFKVKQEKNNNGASVATASVQQLDQQDGEEKTSEDSQEEDSQSDN